MADQIRRNGNRAACEPCRKSKLRCDHAKHCGRCIRRRLPASQCYYHPNPMARPKDSPIVTVKSPVQPVTPLSVSMAPFAPQPMDLDRATSLVGMHGSFVEFEDAETTSSLRTYTALTRNGVALPAGVSIATPALIAEGAVVLERIHSVLFPRRAYVNQKFETEGTECQMGDHFIASATWYAAFEAIVELGSEPGPARFQDMSRRIFEATSKPFEFPPTAQDNAVNRALSRHNLRWETVSLLTSHLGAHLASGPGSKTMIHRLYVTTTKCQSFWEYLGQVNDLTLWAMFRIASLATWCYGDDSYNAWQALGNMCSVALALNFHQGFGDDASVPGYVIELRRRAVALAHEFDKQMSTFVGRPPRLNRHCFVVDLPLDISHEALISSPDDFEKAKADLDQDGWNKSGMVTSTSRLRAMYQIVVLREEVLELSLSQNPPDPGMARDILDRLDRTWRAMPFARYDGCRWSDLEYTTCVIVRWLRVEYLYTKFLLHKMLVNYGNSNHADLIRVSHEILDIVLQNVRDRNALTMDRADLEFIMVFYGMPTASILLLELYRISRQPHQPIPVSRSTIIKDLSALIASCDWIIEEGQGNSDLCKRAQAIFSRGLDRILDESYGPSASKNMPVVFDQPAAMQQPTPSTTTGLTDGFIQDDEWNAWLESYGLQGEQWLDFSFDNNLANAF